MSEVSNKIETDDPNKNNNTSSQMNRYSIEHPQGNTYNIFVNLIIVFIFKYSNLIYSI